MEIFRWASDDIVQEYKTKFRTGLSSSCRARGAGGGVTLATTKVRREGILLALFVDRGGTIDDPVYMSVRIEDTGQEKLLTQKACDTLNPSVARDPVRHAGRLSDRGLFEHAWPSSGRA